ncbi:glycosyltransferase family 4 protein [Ilumatobacter sp.]|uniref:glycosyltransferase family 4 protein n=1 Tax=Ilumatobacter sp. TaxID=1967498 RepID=UPI003B51D43F
MRVLVALSGIHRVARGAEVALESIADGLGRLGHDVEVVGTGPHQDGRSYRYRRIPVVERERFARWPTVPPLRDPAVYEGITTVPGLLFASRPADHDITITCGFPVENVVLRRPSLRGCRPRHVFVTENGDWPAQQLGREAAALFSCDGLVCTNPVYLARNRDRWRTALIPNGVDVERFAPGPDERRRLGLPVDVPVVLMVSALIDSKRIERGIEAVAALSAAGGTDGVASASVLVVAGTGPEHDRLVELGQSALGDRFSVRAFDFDDMPALYRSADVLYHPTLLESFGNVYIEAMACGIPVVAHRSEVTEWIVGEHGWLVDTDDAPTNVAALRAALDDRTDRAAISDEVRDRFSWASVALRYERFCADVLSS